jgi:3-hydroxyisobutyrate dehydrogenase-like beta-hydroxyacid dehydrogenase
LSTIQRTTARQVKVSGTTIAVLGLGEAGRLIAAGLAQAGAVVRGYDPLAGPPAGVSAATDAAQACHGAEVVLSINSAAAALTALNQGLPGCGSDVLWADLNTAAPAVKEELARVAGDRAFVVDVAVMGAVPPRGIATPMAASGPGAESLARTLRPYGASIEVIDGPVGAAATRKLVRSVFQKGMAAAVVEALAAARAAGLEEWLSANIATELTRADASTLERLVVGSRLHAVRRIHEMQAAAELLDALGVPARVTRASQDWLTDLAGESD